MHNFSQNKCLGSQMLAYPWLTFGMLHNITWRPCYTQKPTGTDTSAQSESTTFLSLAEILKANGYDVPTKKVPAFLIKFMALFDKEAKGMVPLLNKSVSCDNSATVAAFNWQPRPIKTTILDMAKTVQKVLEQRT